MSSQMILLPNGNFGFWSTMVNGYTAFNLTKNQMVQYRLDHDMLNPAVCLPNLDMLADGKNYIEDDRSISWGESLKLMALNKQDGGVKDIQKILDLLKPYDDYERVRTEARKLAELILLRSVYFTGNVGRGLDLTECALAMISVLEGEDPGAASEYTVQLTEAMHGWVKDRSTFTLEAYRAEWLRARAEVAAEKAEDAKDED